jgi:hypothetical protein
VLDLSIDQQLLASGRDSYPADRGEMKRDTAAQAYADEARRPDSTVPVPPRRATKSPPPGVPRQNIIWIASYPKSGNTWVRVFLHNILREMRGETEGAQDINALNRFTAWEHSVPHYTRVLGKPPGEANLEEMARARPHVQRLISTHHKGLALTKTHLCFGVDHGFPTIDLSITRAVIYLVRNPLDVAISYAHHCARNIDAVIADMAKRGMFTPPSEEYVSETLGTWSQHVASWIGIADRPVLVIRYEDMLVRSSLAFGTLCLFLNLRPSIAQLKTAIQKSSFEELSRQEQENGFREKPEPANRFFRAGRANQWRKGLTPPQVQTILRDHAPMMQRLGYLPPGSGAFPSRPIVGDKAKEQ